MFFLEISLQVGSLEEEEGEEREESQRTPEDFAGRAAKFHDMEKKGALARMQEMPICTVANVIFGHLCKEPRAN